MVCFGFTVFRIRICFRQSSENRSNQFSCADHLKMFYALPKVPLSTQVYKWVPANLVLRVTLRWTSIPPRGQ